MLRPLCGTMHTYHDERSSHQTGPSNCLSCPLSIHPNPFLQSLTMKVPKEGFPGFPKGLDDDCDRPACDDTVSALKSAMDRFQSRRSSPPVASSPTKSKQEDIVECPPTSPELGRASWALLHSMAAWYPDTPTAEDKLHMKSFMSAFARFYPCTWCARDFQKNLKKSPVRTSTREELCTWLCEQHNIVNQKLGKPAYPCDMKTLDERWRKSSDPRCDSDH